MPEVPPRIGIIGPYPPYRGGIAQFTERFRQALEEAGCVTNVVSFRRLYPSLLFPGRSQETGAAEPLMEASRLLDSMGPWSWKKAARYLSKKGIDRAVFMHWMPFFTPAYAGVAARLHQEGIPCSAIVHNARPHEGQPFSGPLTRRFLKHCEHVVALSETVRRDLMAMGIESGPGIDIEVRHHPTYDQFGDGMDRVEARRILGLPQEGTLLLFFGLVRHYKGVDILLDAMTRTTSRPHLVVAGEWYEDRASADALIRSEGLSDRVRLEDRYIPDDQVALYFSAADAVVQPYRSATQSGVVQTAFHFGKPVIVTGVGGLPEVATHEEDALVVAPEDAVALATAIDRIEEPDILARLSRGAARSRNRFSWEHFIEPFLSA